MGTLGTGYVFFFGDNPNEHKAISNFLHNNMATLLRNNKFYSRPRTIYRNVIHSSGDGPNGRTMPLT
jgi:hypothetical protein